MLSNQAAVLALRARLLTLSVSTTGSVTLSATTTGYARTTGSFLDEQFAVGMEITPAGFTANTVDVLTGVTALTLTTKNARAAETAASGRSISVGLPALRAWENLDFEPTTGRPFVEEDYLPGPAAQVTLGPLGQIETLPQYVVKFYGLRNTGTGALYRMADAALALFAPRTGLTLSTGDVVTVQTNPAPYRSQLIPSEPGWAVCVVTVPCRGRSANVS